ncbi:hypothetical protein NDU88_001760 [Pleurodeles waltl]|uniref:Uncharacterized protein n=1 Tax=Pleurodeles waltl TaxID=8319 RepID=A0AAV7KQE7_PLEWA|nr:hypothetical protein NDU88_001760 [Pleurodeles waltl]
MLRGPRRVVILPGKIGSVVSLGEVCLNKVRRAALSHQGSPGAFREMKSPQIILTRYLAFTYDGIVVTRDLKQSANLDGVPMLNQSQTEMDARKMDLSICEFNVGCGNTEPLDVFHANKYQLLVFVL